MKVSLVLVFVLQAFGVTLWQQSVYNLYQTVMFPSSSYLNSSSPTFRDLAQLADDFEVPADEAWYITHVRVDGNSEEQLETASRVHRVEFYGDDGSGVISNLIAAYEDLYNVNQQTINMTIIPPLRLSSGRYWLSPFKIYNTTVRASRWLVAAQQNASPVLNPTRYRETNGLFYSSSESWVSTLILTPGAFERDMRFDIYGVRVTPNFTEPLTYETQTTEATQTSDATQTSEATQTSDSTQSSQTSNPGSSSNGQTSNEESQTSVPSTSSSTTTGGLNLPFPEIIPQQTTYDPTTGANLVLVDSTGVVLATLHIPPDAGVQPANASLPVTVIAQPTLQGIIQSSLNGYSLSDILSTVISFELQNALSNIFSKPVEIRFQVHPLTGYICLGFINTATGWECTGLPTTTETVNGTLFAVGSTLHFTNFAILLTKESPSEDMEVVSSSKDADKSVMMIVVGVCVGLAIIGIILGVIGVLYYYKRKASRRASAISNLPLHHSTTTE